jgi:hypothetical protein
MPSDDANIRARFDRPEAGRDRLDALCRQRRRSRAEGHGTAECGGSGHRLPLETNGLIDVLRGERLAATAGSWRHATSVMFRRRLAV